MIIFISGGINIWQLFLCVCVCVCVTLLLYFWGIQNYLKIMRVVLHKKRRNSCLQSTTKSIPHHVLGLALSLQVFRLGYAV